MRPKLLLALAVGHRGTAARLVLAVLAFGCGNDATVLVGAASGAASDAVDVTTALEPGPPAAGG